MSDTATRLRAERMAAHDALSKEQRALVHDYGSFLVTLFMRAGVKKPKTIRCLIKAVLRENPR